MAVESSKGIRSLVSSWKGKEFHETKTRIIHLSVPLPSGNSLSFQLLFGTFLFSDNLEPFGYYCPPSLPTKPSFFTLSNIQDSFLLPLKWSQFPMPDIQGSPGASRSSNLYLPSYFTMCPTTLTLSLWLNISHPLLSIVHLFTPQTFIECLLCIISSVNFC